MKSHTQGTKFLESHNIQYSTFTYRYQEKGGANLAAKFLNISPNQVVKTIVLKDSNKQLYVVLMHGDLDISLKKFAREVEKKSVSLCPTKEVFDKTGYVVGGVSPFGMRNSFPMYIEHSILDLEEIWINGGKRGLLVKVAVSDITSVLEPTTVKVANLKNS